jgi:perosamine synthetase
MTGGQSLRLRHVAPAGAPIGLPDLVRWAGLAVAGGDVAESLQQEFCARFDVRHSFLTCTGRAGMTVLLRALRRLAPSQRNEVIVPAYTCYSVAASVIKAGLRPRIVDVSPETLDYEPARLAAVDFTRVLAIVATNLYGLPNDMPALGDIARRHGVFLVDDAAQAMGASIGGRRSGTWGDAGLFSLDKGKNVSAIDGGVLVTNSDEVAAALKDEVAALPKAGISESGAGVMKALVYFLMLRPWLYWIPNRIPQLELGKTVFTTEFALERPSRALVALGRTMVSRLDDFTRARVGNAERLLDRLQAIPGVRAVAPIAGAVPVYLRLPILFADPGARQRALTALNANGIGATASYPASLVDVPELTARIGASAAAPGGRAIARQIVTLPTHAFVTHDDVERAAAVLVDAQRDTSGAC